MAERGVTSREVGHSFARATPAAHRRAAGDPQTLTRLAAIDERTDAVKAKVIEHYRKFEDRWVAREGIALWKRRLADAARYPSPPGERREVSEAEIMRIAARNVEASVNRRLSKVNGIRTRVQNAVARTPSQPGLTRQFEQDAPEMKQKANRKIQQ